MPTTITGTNGVNQVAPNSVDFADLKNTLFNGLLSANGYVKIPVRDQGVERELIIQWGAHTFNFAGVGTLNTSVTFPIAFPNQVLSASSQAVSNFAADLILVTSLTVASNTTGVLYTKSVNSYTGPVPVRWIAIGY